MIRFDKQGNGVVYYEIENSGDCNRRRTAVEIPLDQYIFLSDKCRTLSELRREILMYVDCQSAMRKIVQPAVLNIAAGK